MLHAGPGDQLSGTAEPNQPIGERGQRCSCAQSGGGGGVTSLKECHLGCQLRASGVGGVGRLR